jgi:hypothetical protein
MPSKKFIITILGGTFNGFSIVKFSQIEANNFIDLIEENYNLECQLEIIDLLK